MSRKSMLIRAPKDVVYQWRDMFGNKTRDADVVRVMWNATYVWPRQLVMKELQRIADVQKKNR